MFFASKKKKVARSYSKEEIAQKTTHFIAQRTRLLSEDEITPATPLFSSGVLDSMAFLALVSFLESKFEVRLPDGGEVSMKTLDSVEAIVKVIESALSR